MSENTRIANGVKGHSASAFSRQESYHPDYRNQARQSGISFLELLIGMVLFGVMTMMTLPTMRDFVTAYRMDAQTDRFVSAVQTARTMAISYNTPITLCALDGNDNCSTDPADWGKEWAAFYDCNANGKIDSGPVCDDGQPETVFAHDDDGTAQWSLSMSSASNGIPAKINFDYNGIPITASDCWGVAFTLTNQDNADPRTVFLNAQGRVFVADTNNYSVNDDCDQIALAALSSSGSSGSSGSTSGSSGGSSGDGDDTSSSGSSSGGDGSGSGSSSGGDDGSSSSGGDDGSSSGDEGSSSGDEGTSSGSSSGGGSGSSSGDTGGEEETEDPPPLCTTCEKEDWCTKVEEEYLTEGVTIPLGNSDNFVTIQALDYKDGNEKIGFTLLTNNNFQVKFGTDVDFLDDQVVGAIQWDSDAPNYHAISHVVFCVPNSFQLDGDYSGFPEWEPE